MSLKTNSISIQIICKCHSKQLTNMHNLFITGIFKEKLKSSKIGIILSRGLFWVQIRLLWWRRGTIHTTGTVCRWYSLFVQSKISPHNSCGAVHKLISLTDRGNIHLTAKPCYQQYCGLSCDASCTDRETTRISCTLPERYLLGGTFIYSNLTGAIHNQYNNR